MFPRWCHFKSLFPNMVSLWEPLLLRLCHFWSQCFQDCVILRTMTDFPQECVLLGTITDVPQDFVLLGTITDVSQDYVIWRATTDVPKDFVIWGAITDVPEDFISSVAISDASKDIVNLQDIRTVIPIIIQEIPLWKLMSLEKNFWKVKYYPEDLQWGFDRIPYRTQQELWGYFKWIFRRKFTKFT